MNATCAGCGVETRGARPLLDAIHTHLGDRFEMTGDGSGAHIVLWPSRRASERTIITRAAAVGVGVYGMSHCFLTRPSRPGIILGYSRMSEDEIREGIRLFAGTL